MPPALESRLFGLGYLLIFGAIFAFAGFAYYSDTSFAAEIVALIIGRIVIEWIRRKRISRRLQEALNAAFATFHGTIPSITEGNSHGFPYFTLTFYLKPACTKLNPAGKSLSL